MGRLIPSNGPICLKPPRQPVTLCGARTHACSVHTHVTASQTPSGVAACQWQGMALPLEFLHLIVADVFVAHALLRAASPLMGTLGDPFTFVPWGRRSWRLPS